MIGAGELKYSITFWDRTDQKESDYGSVDDSFAEGITCRAGWKQLSGSETLLSETVSNRTAGQFKIRYRSSIVETSYIVFQGNKYNIEVIDHDSFNGVTLITVIKIVDR